ncbi:hypothetical protein [Burkholderia anthina]|uniref:hypothetical protein n=1 Tax=Burkholderia anthina TaxID=179879 RepID=UPI00158AFB6D|nr:hypothetical protein [Burkholderia anthina]
MRFSVDAFNTFLGGIGQAYNWYQATRCPCIDPHSGAAKPNCQLCFGKGYQFASAVPGVAGLSGQKTQRAWEQSGNYERGDIVVTIPSDTPLYAIGQFDRITALSATNPFSLVLTSGMAAKERLIFAVQSITGVSWINAAGTGMVQGGIPTVNANGTLSWPNGGQPPAGVQYTIKGTKFLDYFCFGEYAQNRAHNGGLTLPRRVVLRDFDLFNR